MKLKLRQLMCGRLNWKNKLDKLAGYILSITTWILCVYECQMGEGI